jgi:hypothetical protein
MTLRLILKNKFFESHYISKVFTVREIEISKYLIYLFMILSADSFAANDNYPSGARASGLSNSGVVLTDLWANYHNQACLARVEKLSLGFHYENKYIVDEYGLHAIAIAVPAYKGTIGASVTFFGYKKYNESKISLAYGKSFGERFSAGIQLDLLNIYQEEDYGNNTTLAVEAGILAEPLEGLYIGAHVYNPTKASYNMVDLERVPTIFQAGIGYYLTEKLFLVVETEKDLEEKPVFQCGTEYHLIKNIFARFGISTYEISRYSFGVGFAHKGIEADMAFSHHQILGYTPHLSFSYSFR